MENQERMFLRMSDVGISLAAAGKYEHPLSRIELQKFVYLLDIVAYLYEILPPREGHVTYKRGPYDFAIQNAADSLAFRGLIDIVSIKQRKQGEIQTRYILNSSGKRWLGQIIEWRPFIAKWEAALSIAKKINQLGWDHIVRLVYSEPTFIDRKTFGYGQRLEPYNGLENTAASFFRIITHGLTYGFDNNLPNEELLIKLFIRYLDEFSRASDIRFGSSPENPLMELK